MSHLTNQSFNAQYISGLQIVLVCLWLTVCLFRSYQNFFDLLYLSDMFNLCDLSIMKQNEFEICFISNLQAVESSMIKPVTFACY